MLGIVVSRADDASVHIGERLRDVCEWTVQRDDRRSDADGGGDVWRTDGAELREFDALHLDTEGIAAAFEEPSLLAFASKHAGDTGELLTAHHTGNFGQAQFGGADGEFARACPNALSRVVEALDAYAPEGYDVGMECTHHGPTEVGVPSMFVEVGSDQPQWEDPDAAEAVARAILDLRGVEADAASENGSRRHLVGFGGGHYVPRFERIVRETDWSIGHVGAAWALSDMGDPDENRGVIERAFRASAAEYAVVDGEYPALERVIEDMGHRVVSETFVRETTGVPLSLVESVEQRLGAVGEGIRFGDPARGYEESFVDAALPAELRDEAQGIDAAAARRAVAGTAIAYDTLEGGNRLGERVALADGNDRRVIVTELAEILEERYDSVELREEAVVAERERFDPEKARTLGVPEGPAFGKLSAGQSVEVEGHEIDPEVVHVERTERFPL